MMVVKSGEASRKGHRSGLALTHMQAPRSWCRLGLYVVCVVGCEALDVRCRACMRESEDRWFFGVWLGLGACLLDHPLQARHIKLGSRKASGPFILTHAYVYFPPSHTLLPTGPASLPLLPLSAQAPTSSNHGAPACRPRPPPSDIWSRRLHCL